MFSTGCNASLHGRRKSTTCAAPTWKATSSGNWLSRRLQQHGNRTPACLVTRQAAHRVDLESSCSSFNHARWKPTGVTPAYRTIPQGVPNEEYLDLPRQITETVATADGATGTFVYTLQTRRSSSSSLCGWIARLFR